MVDPSKYITVPLVIVVGIMENFNWVSFGLGIAGVLSIQFLIGVFSGATEN